jgi:hypothetical protein
MITISIDNNIDSIPITILRMVRRFAGKRAPARKGLLTKKNQVSYF